MAANAIGAITPSDARQIRRAREPGRTAPMMPNSSAQLISRKYARFRLSWVSASSRLEIGARTM